jgi:hypothetical protein
MKKYSLFLIAGICGLMIFSCAGKSINICDRVRNGKFYYYSKHTREKIFVDRGDGIQIETGEDGNTPITGKVIWKNDCRFDIFFTPPNSGIPTLEDSVIAATPAHVEILSVNDNYYVCIAEMNLFDSSIEIKDTVYFRK